MPNDVAHYPRYRFPPAIISHGTMSDSTIETSGCVEDQRITGGDVQIIVA